MISWFEKHNVISFILVLIIAAAIFYCSTWTGGGLGPALASWKTIAYHFVVFFFLSLFLLISFVQGKSKRKSLIAIALLLALAYGISDEFHQLFVQGRSCAISDFLIDSAGIYLSCFLYTVSLKIRYPGNF
jgi:hypothetical protein